MTKMMRKKNVWYQYKILVRKRVEKFTMRRRELGKIFITILM